MPDLDKPNAHLPVAPVKWRFPAVHPEGRKFVVIAAVIAFSVYVMISHFVGWLLILLTIWVAAFFRDPIRVTPRSDKWITAPADGLVILISKVPPPPELRGSEGMPDGDYTRVSIFMSVFDVHINRAPISGRVKRMAYVPGKFVNADLDKASEDNERQHFLIERDDGLKIGFTQIAGLIARRIMAFVREGDTVEAGQRVGLIRFGSRVDVYLPAGTVPRVLLGQRSIAGETIIGEVGGDPKLTGVSQ
ncbi:MAG: phosphatidylserine decarboxylase [Sphingomicrobium sp.]